MPTIQDLKTLQNLPEKYYYGETNAFYIFLDLLEKVGDKND